MQSPVHVLFLCTGNSARSILAEALLNHKGAGRFRAWSAGSRPTGAPRPEALRQLSSCGIATEGLRSKSWLEFSGPEAPQMDLIFTVCGNAAQETCPIWPGHPATAHWGLPDPAAIEGSEEERALAFATAYAVLERRIDRLLALPLDTLGDAALREALAEIGRS